MRLRLLFGVFLFFSQFTSNRSSLFTNDIYLLLIGILFLIGGILFWISASLHFQKAKEMKKVAVSGPYFYVRHPIYISIYIISIGLGFIFFAWMWFIVLAAFIPFWYLECMKEEKQMVKLFGQEYLDYKDKVLVKKLSLSTRVYIGLIIALAILAYINVFLPQGSFLPDFTELPASKTELALVNAAVMLILYGGLGYVGLKLSKKLDFADVWDSELSNKQRFLIPAYVGIAIGIFFIFADIIFNRFNNLEPFPHPPFPTSIIVSATAGIGEEVIFRLFFITFWVWLISKVIFKQKWQNVIFWIVAVFSAITFSLGHIPSVMIMLDLNKISEIPFTLLSEIILLNGILSLFTAYYFRKYGFLAAVGIHFWTDIIWHVIWGIL